MHICLRMLSFGVQLYPMQRFVITFVCELRICLETLKMQNEYKQDIFVLNFRQEIH
jgi:hypothetical protein